MSTLTPNYKFVKPELSDPANPTATNGNWDILDQELSKAGSQKLTVESLVVSETDNGKILMVVDGKATWVTINVAEGVSF